MYCLECGELMRLASVVRPSASDDGTVRVFECKPCEIIEVEHSTPIPSAETIFGDALSDKACHRAWQI